MEKYYDIHCHVFNKNVISRKLVGILQSLALIIDKIKDKTDNEETQDILMAINDSLDDLQTTSENVFKVIDKVYDSKFVLVPLMIDLTYVDDNDGTNGQNQRHKRQVLRLLVLIRETLRIAIRHSLKKETRKLLTNIMDGIQKQIKKTRKAKDTDLDFFPEQNYVQQIEELEYISENHNNAKPFFGLDPRREYKDHKNLLELVKQKLLGSEPAFCGIKLYAPIGFSPTDPVLMGTNVQEGIYNLCEENKIPITVHCSDSGFACFSRDVRINGYIKNGKELIEYKNQILTFNTKTISNHSGDAIKERANKLNHPSIWRKVLEKYPDLFINFAHFGGSTPLMQFVTCEIPENLRSMKIDDFEDEIEDKLSIENRSFALSCYEKKHSKMNLNDSLTFTERKKLWGILYNDNIIDNWSKAILDIIREPKFKNAYTDLSCFSAGDAIEIIDNGNTKRVFKIEDNLKTFKHDLYDKLPQEIQKKFLYGSDFFFIEFFGPKLEYYIKEFKSVFGKEFKTIASQNPEKFLGITSNN